MKKTLLVTCAAAIGLFAVQANAADVIAPAPEETTYYLSLFGGASLLEDVKSEYDGNGLGYEVESKTGHILGGAIGARIWDPLRAEVGCADELSRSDGEE